MVSKSTTLGAHLENGGARFSVYATGTTDVAVRLFHERGLVDHRLERVGDGLFEGFVRGVDEGALYKFVVGGRELPDPFARSLPSGVHGPAAITALPPPGPTPTTVARPLEAHVVYEIHVGTFSSEGTFQGVIAELPHLEALGVTAIELMPIAAFAGDRGWGYDGVALFAPHPAYGSLRDLRALIDAAHRAGIAVFLDVVYNHFGPSGNYLGAYAKEYFRSDVKTPWGDAPDFGHAPMRRLVLENVHHWLADVGFDGLRLDATHAFVDEATPSIVRAIVDLAASFSPKKIVIAEDERNDPALVLEHGVDAIWSDDFHHQLHVTLTGERDGYYRAFDGGAPAIAETINRGWFYEGQHYEPFGTLRGKPAEALEARHLVYCLQNHDQVGNRALGERLSAQTPLDAYAAASLLLLFLPMTPLLFMGQEWAAASPFAYFTDHEAELGRQVTEGRRNEFRAFDAFGTANARETIPDPQAVETFANSRLFWAERTSESHARVLALYKEAIRLRREDPVLRDSSRTRLRASAREDVLVVERRGDAGRRILLVNFGGTRAPFEALPIDVRNMPLLLTSDGRVEPPPTERADEALPMYTAMIFGGHDLPSELG